MIKKYGDFLLESAPRIPNKEEYWTKKGKTGKDVCLIFHDDLDGCVSAIVMKSYLLKLFLKLFIHFHIIGILKKYLNAFTRLK